MRGRGRSSRAARPEDYHFDRLVDDVLKLMEAVAVRKAVFVGVALGAQIIMELAVRRPDVLLGAIFNDSAPESNPAAGARMVKFAGGDELTLEEARARVVAQYQEQFPRMGDAEYDRLVYRNYAKSETGGYIRDFDQRTNEDLARLKKERPTFWTEFEAIQAPIALIRGENSDYITPEIMERTLAANRNAKLYTIPDAGHPAMFWEAEVFAAVDELLAKVDGQA
jgi:pimeloyl-ACP methyl ester carboxylesterase